MLTVLVTGGTGSLGRSIVRKLIERGERPRLFSRNANASVPPGAELAVGDLAMQIGVDGGTRGTDCIIHCASNPTDPTADIESTWSLLESAVRNGVHRFVYISIVGVDRPSAPYYETKYNVERVIRNFNLPSVILRATQFHSFVAGLIERLTRDLSKELRVPAGVRLQTIETEEVADRLLELAKTEFTGRTEDIGGPEILSLEEMVRDYLAARNRSATLRTVEAKTFTDLPWVAWTGRTQLCPDHRYGKVTWKEYLRREYGPF
jgi:uncharacterized protein YbjT (DUF2867 family)